MDAYQGNGNRLSGYDQRSVPFHSLHTTQSLTSLHFHYTEIYLANPALLLYIDLHQSIYEVWVTNVVKRLGLRVHTTTCMTMLKETTIAQKVV